MSVRLRRPASDVDNDGQTGSEADVLTLPASAPEKLITAPMIGTFYTSATPGAQPFVNEGDEVSVGQTIGIIEAMKIMNEIESEVAGVVTEVLASDAQPVEYGQPLFRIDPNG
jgi:acetyl-CoA carboxylase biotin carboxyl carrier protein